MSLLGPKGEPVEPNDELWVSEGGVVGEYVTDDRTSGEYVPITQIELRTVIIDPNNRDVVAFRLVNSHGFDPPFMFVVDPPLAAEFARGLLEAVAAVAEEKE